MGRRPDAGQEALPDVRRSKNRPGVKGLRREEGSHCGPGGSKHSDYYVRLGGPANIAGASGPTVLDGVATAPLAAHEARTGDHSVRPPPCATTPERARQRPLQQAPGRTHRRQQQDPRLRFRRTARPWIPPNGSATNRHCSRHKPARSWPLGAPCGGKSTAPGANNGRPAASTRFFCRVGRGLLRKTGEGWAADDNRRRWRVRKSRPQPYDKAACSKAEADRRACPNGVSDDPARVGRLGTTCDSTATGTKVVKEKTGGRGRLGSGLRGDGVPRPSGPGPCSSKHGIRAGTAGGGHGLKRWLASWGPQPSRSTGGSLCRVAKGCFFFFLFFLELSDHWRLPLGQGAPGVVRCKVSRGLRTSN